MTARTVAVAGATGFVGEALCARLAAAHRVVGLSRSERRPAPGDPVAQWRRCDLFSLLDAERALEGVDIAFYLVHAMMPSARLTQGSVEDLDLVAADNFARAAATRGVKQIIYLGGIVPPGTKLSRHLASRLEVEETLRAYGVPVTTLRAGLIVGKDGSSFVMLERLVRRLPAMVCPAWTDTPMQPIDVRDVVVLLDYCLGRESTFGQVYDIGGPDVITYRQLIKEVSDRLGLTRYLISIPLFTPTLSRLWVRLVTGAPRDLVYPLVESLVHPMVAQDRRLQDAAGVPGRTLAQCIDDSLGESGTPQAFRGGSRAQAERVVRSVQRLPLPRGETARWAAEEYLRWLPRLVPPLRVTVTGGRAVFRFWGVPLSLLELTISEKRSTLDRALLYITGGLLSLPGGRGRVEFRQPRGRDFLLVAVHDFRPRLPWLLYTLTQAQLHLVVMRSFARHLMRLCRDESARPAPADAG